MIDNTKFLGMSDEDILLLIKNDNKDALEYLITKYNNLVVGKVNKYFIIGAEKEDIIQEGLIGLYKAIKSYKPDSEASFKSFANLCIERQLITAIKTSNRQKHMPLNSYLSINMNAFDDNTEGENEGMQIQEVLENQVSEDPLDTITKKEYMEFVGTVIDKNLSDFEKQVFNKYLQGESYNNIAESLNTPVKSIDNAIQRIRKKTIKNLNTDL
jgi:RNA polymerase sporulation-specific sigma factor